MRVFFILRLLMFLPIPKGSDVEDFRGDAVLII